MSALVPLLFGLSALLLAAALVVWALGTLRRAREAEGGAAPASTDDDDAKAPAVDLVALDTRLRRDFAAGAARVAALSPGRSGRYRAPWVLVVGESGAGKGAMLAAAGLARPAEARAAAVAAGGPSPLAWEIYEEGVALDVRGDLFLRSDGGAHEAGWRRLLKLLARHRPARPIDGVVLVIPASALRGAAARERARLRGETIFRRLREAQRTLSVRFPVHVVVSRCDALPGFATLAAQLSGEARAEAFGWSSPHAAEAAFQPGWVDEALETMDASLIETQAELLAGSPDADGLFQLPGELKALGPALAEMLEEVFREGAFHESFFFRGLHFTGTADPLAALTAAPAEALAADADAATGAGDPDAVPAPAPLAVPVFVRDLLGAKVFAERNLARRAEGRGITRDRATVGVQAALALLLLVGSAGLWMEGRRIERRDAEAGANLARVAGELEELDGDARVLAMLDDVSVVQPRVFRSLFLPTSWPSPLRRRITETAAGVFGDVILPAMRDSLTERAERLAPRRDASFAAYTSGAPGAAAGAAEVERYLGELARLSAAVRSFNTLAEAGSGKLAEFDSLQAYVFREPGREMPRARRVLMERALRLSRTPPLRESSHTDAALARAGVLVEAAYDRLRDEVGELGAGVDAALAAGPGGLPLEEYRRMAGRVDVVRGQVGADWLRPGAPLPPSLAKALQAIPNSPVISGDALRARFPARFQEVREARLHETGTSMAAVYGSDLPGEEGEGGLSGSTLALRSALDALAGRSFTGAAQPVSLASAPTAGTWTRWDLRRLDEALALHADFQAFDREGLGGVRGGARTLVRGLATVQLEARMTQRVAAARSTVEAPEPVGLPARERELRARAAELRAAAGRILRVMAVFDSLGLVRPYGELAGALAAQEAALLGEAARLLADLGPYAPLDPSFAGWRGARPVAAPAFGAADAAELEGYLAAQRARIGTIAHGIAAPLLADLRAPAFARYLDETGESGPAAGEAARWGALLAALDGYEARAAGNTLVALEELIRTGIDAVDLSDCAGSLPRRGTSDLFGQLRERIRAPLLARCRSLGRSAAERGYARLQGAFRRDLAGRFPFAAANAAAGDADPEAVRAFLAAWDETAWARAAVASGGAGVGGPSSPAARWLEAVAAARPFLDAVLAADTTGGPAFLVEAEFRAFRPRERGGAQVAEWAMEVGATRLTPRDSAGTRAEWRRGDGVRLLARWADDAPARPAPPAAGAGYEVRGRAARWSAGGDWALLRLLTSLSATAAELGGPPSRSRHALALRVPLVSEAADSADGGRARVFVRVRLRDPASGAERALPAFPADAPALTRGFDEAYGGDDDGWAVEVAAAPEGRGW